MDQTMMTKKLIAFLAILLQLSPAYAGLPPTTSKVSGDSTDITTFNFRFPNFAASRSGVVTTLGTLAIAGGGTGVVSATTAPTASSFSAWDANSNHSANSHLDGYATTATAAGTTTLKKATVLHRYDDPNCRYARHEYLGFGAILPHREQFYRERNRSK